MQQLRGAALTASLIALAFVTGCIFSPEQKPPAVPVDPPSYPKAITPQLALENLVKAYVARDSVETEKIYDVGYEGISNYPGAPAGGALFSRYDEVRHVGALKLNVNVVSVFLDLGASATWRRLPGNAGDPVGWAVIPIPASTVRIDDVGANTLWESVNRIIEYTFKPNVAAPGDTTWTVVRWSETAN